jgi:cytochrome b involved in lipid metabolism
MKKYSTISLFIFWTVVVVVITAGVVSLSNRSNQNQQTVTGGANNITGVSPSVSTLKLSMTELAKHNSSSSCWLLISGKIYDVTNFLIQHPGGESTILPTCGTDATVDYNTKDRPNPRTHSANASTMLADYYIGDLNQTLQLNSSTAASGAAKTNSVTKNQATPAATVKTPIPAPTKTTPQTQTTLALTSAELAKHNSINSCWLLISGKIYDVTTFMNSHPGGVAEILNTCGTDATAAYASRGGTGTHSSSANAMLAAYYIGDLNQTVVTSPASPTTPSIANPTFTPPTGRGDDEFEDD